MHLIALIRRLTKAKIKKTLVFLSLNNVSPDTVEWEVFNIMGNLFGGGGGSDNSGALAAQQAAQQQAAQQQQWLQEQTTAQQNTQNQSAQAQALQQQTDATNTQQAAAAKQAQLKATQESAAEAAATPYTSSQNATALQPINSTASLVAGATGAGNNTTGFNSVLAKQKAASGFLGQQNSLNSTGARLGGS